MNGKMVSWKVYLVFLLLSLVAMSCATPREDEDTEQGEADNIESNSTEEGEQNNALREYISEPKKRAKDTKVKIERAQDAAKRQMDEEVE